MHVCDLMEIIRSRSDFIIRGDRSNRKHWSAAFAEKSLFLLEPDGSIVPKNSFIKDIRVKVRPMFLHAAVRRGVSVNDISPNCP